MIRLGDAVNKIIRKGQEPEEFLPRERPLKRKRELSPQEIRELKKRRAEGRKWVLVLVLATVVLSLGFLVWGKREAGWQGMISPVGEKISDGEPATRITRKETETTENEIRDLTRDLQGTYGVYVYNLTDKYEYGINQDEVFIAASLIKLPVILTLYQEAEATQLRQDSDGQGKIDLETDYVLKAKDKRAGAGVIQYKPAGTVYTYRELAKFMCRYSDNTAFNVIRQLLGDEKIQALIDDLGMTSTSLEENETTPADIGLFFRKFYSFSLLTRNHRDEIIDYLTKTAFEDRIPVGVPEEVKVAHKIGNEVNSFSDAGIVFGKKPFILVIMSKDALEKEALEALPEITRIVWEFEN
jgi:beta-lactamase class A